MADDDSETGTYLVSYSPEKRIPEADAVYVMVASAEEELAAGLIAGEKAVENGMVDTRGRPNLSRSASTLSLRRGFHKAADKPIAEPSGLDLVDGRTRFALKRGGERRHKRIVCDAEVLDALPDAPGAGRWLPIQLFICEPGNERLGRFVVCGKVLGEAVTPRERERGLRRGHV